MAERKFDERFEGLRRKAEKLVGDRDAWYDGDSADAIHSILHELQVHQAELEIQNEELRRTERERAELQLKYEALYQYAPCGYVTIDNCGQLSRINLKAAEFLDLEGRRWSRLTFADYLGETWRAAFFEAQAQAAETGLSQSLELCLYSEKQRWVQAEISAEMGDEGKVRQWRVVMVDISRRKETEFSLEEKKTMLREIHHRVKNNMQVISSLISFQARALPEGESRSVLEDVKQRVGAMALVHEMLYQSDNLAFVSFDSYVSRLTTQLSRAHGGEASIRRQEELAPVHISVHQALPACLIVHELYSNALRHAFQGRRQGRLRMNMKCGEDNVVRLAISDDGIGLPEGFDWRQAESLGLRIVSMLTRQLGGEVDVDTSPEGTTFTLTFALQY